MSAQDHGIFTNLRGTVCACGDPKKDGKSFCRSHYFRLPQDMRTALYQRAGYADAYRAALKYLGLDEPKAEPQPAAPKQREGGTLRDVFPNGGVRRRRRVFE